MVVGSDVRKLAAVMFTDIVGYTAMVQEDEDTALSKVEIHRKYVQEYTAQYHGQIIEFYGDASLTIYDSVVDAVRCAIAMQKAYRENGHVPVRIGIHLGDFVVKDGTVFGDGVNIASRIQTAGIAGGILISDKVNAELGNHSDIRTLHLGPYKLKNVAGQVQVYAVTTPGLAVPPKQRMAVVPRVKRTVWLVVPSIIVVAFLMVQYFKGGPDSAANFQEERIAIPAFSDFTGNPEYSSVSKMAAHWITTALLESTDASVVSYQSAVESDQVASATTKSRKLSALSGAGAVNVVEGSYQLCGKNKDSLEFSVNIINLKTGAYIKEITRKLAGIRCQGSDPMQCIGDLADAIDGFWVSKTDKVLEPPTYEAYKDYLAARDVWRKDDTQAEQLLRKSIHEDQGFIDAYFLMLDLYYNHYEYAQADSLISVIKERFTDLTERQKNYLMYHDADNKGHNVEAFKYFMNEYQIDPKDLFVNTSGMVMAIEYLHDPQKAIEFFTEINPDSLDLDQCIYCRTRYSMANYAYQMEGNIRKAKRLADKLRPHLHRELDYQRLIEFYVTIDDTAAANQLLTASVEVMDSAYKGYLYLVAARQAQLRKDIPLRDYYAKKSVALSPDSSRMLARGYYAMDSLDRALEIYTQVLQKLPSNSYIYAEMGVIYARKGDKDNAERIITKLGELKHPFDYGKTSYFQGRIAANLGERQRALELIGKSLEEGRKFYTSETYDQDTDLMMLLDDPEYQKLLHRL